MSKEFKKIFIINNSEDTKIEISKEYIILEQFYYKLISKMKIRCRKILDNYSLTFKMKIDNNEKIEFGYSITKEDYYNLKSIRDSKLITKRRHEFRYEKYIGIYDEFYGDITLKIVSMEFENEEELVNFKCPSCLTEVGDLLTIDEMTM